MIGSGYKNIVTESGSGLVVLCHLLFWLTAASYAYFLPQSVRNTDKINLTLVTSR